MLWDSWTSLAEVSLLGVTAYLGLLLILRVSGKRSLSKLNAFDLVVTVALGSTLATTILSPDVSLTDGLAAFAILIFLQLTVTYLSSRFSAVSDAVKATPTLLVSNGEMLHDVLLRERVTPEEVFQAVRETGQQSAQGMDVVLETNGKLSVIQRDAGPADALDNVR